MDHSAHGGHADHGAMDHSAHNMDHSTMDHSQHMDHSTMDHSQHMAHMVKAGIGGLMTNGSSSCMSSGSHGMGSMAFHGGYCETVLFSDWQISSPGGLIGSMIGIILMAAVYEGIKYYREYLFWKSYNSLQYRAMPANGTNNAPNEDPRIVTMVGEVIHKQPPRMVCWSHALQTLLHMIQLVMAYLLMLIFMTYNYWLGLAVMLGGGLGYFLFGWKKSVIVDVTEHCH